MVTVNTAPCLLSPHTPHLHEVEHGEQLGGQPPAQPEHGARIQPAVAAAEPRAAGSQLQLALPEDN